MTSTWMGARVRTRLWCCLWICLAWFVVSTVAITRSELISKLLVNYDDSVRPFGGTRPVPVYLSYRLSLLYGVSSADESFQVDFFVTERWNDPRLVFNSTEFYLPYGDPLRLPTSSIWKPDTYFFNAIKCTITDTVLQLDTNGNGDVTYTRHSTCTFYTPFDLRSFPFDSQSLSITRMSFAYDYQGLEVSLVSICITVSVPNSSCYVLFSSHTFQIYSKLTLVTYCIPFRFFHLIVTLS